MKRQVLRDRVAQNFAPLTVESSLSSQASAIVEAAIKEDVTITEVLRKTLILEAGIDNGQPESARESESDLVHICCPS